MTEIEAELERYERDMTRYSIVEAIATAMQFIGFVIVAVSVALALAGCAGPIVYDGPHGRTVCTGNCEQLERTIDELHTPDMQRRIDEAQHYGEARR